MYVSIALCTTEWENPRTQTEFNDNLVFKLFAFNFVNNFGSIYIDAFLRLVIKILEFQILKFKIIKNQYLFKFTFPSGFFGLGSSYSDTCSSFCMRQVTFDILIKLLVTPLSRFATVVIIP